VVQPQSPASLLWLAEAFGRSSGVGGPKGELWKLLQRLISSRLKAIAFCCRVGLVMAKTQGGRPIGAVKAVSMPFVYAYTSADAN
jgi:hypothetical protein